MISKLTSTTLRGQTLKIYKPQVHLDVRKFFFTVRIIDVRNSLPISLINCETIATFRKHLDCLLKNRGYISFFSFFPLVKLLFFFLLGWLVELSWVEFSLPLCRSFAAKRCKLPQWGVRGSSSPFKYILRRWNVSCGNDFGSICANQNVLTEVNLACIFSRWGQVPPSCPCLRAPAHAGEHH